jgi:hypothetical protein
VVGRLIARKNSYTLDRKGMTADKYAEAIKDGKIVPPAIDLVLELKNTTKKPMRLRITGAAPRLTLDLKGKGTIVKRTGKRERLPLTYVTLKPGETHVLPLTRLAGFTSSTQETQLFWTEPGEYTLTATLTTYVMEEVMAAAGGVKPGGLVGGKSVRLAPIVSNTLKLSVKAK